MSGNLLVAERRDVAERHPIPLDHILRGFEAGLGTRRIPPTRPPEHTWRSRLGYFTFALAVALSLFGLATVVTGPYHAISAGARLDTRSLAGEATDGDGRLLLTSVRRVDLDAFELLRVWINASETVVRGRARPSTTSNSAGALDRSLRDAVAAVRSYLGPRAGAVGPTVLHRPAVKGPSGGLMFALGMIDAAGGHELTRGRTIAGSGTISADGSVGRVGDVVFKAQAAERAGAEIFLAPSSQVDEARRGAATVRVVGVRTLREAVSALKPRR